MTGKHSGHTSVRSNGGGTPLREGEETVASILKPLGYATMCIGKWHLGDNYPFRPEDRGFQRVVRGARSLSQPRLRLSPP